MILISLNIFLMNKENQTGFQIKKITEIYCRIPA
jgi:hypothetical protein